MGFGETVGRLSVGQVAGEVLGIDEGVTLCASVGASNGLGITGIDSMRGDICPLA